MGHDLQTSPITTRFDHLLSVLSSQRFLRLEGLGNEVPFFIAPFKPKESQEMCRLRSQLIKRLDQLGVTVLDINLYDLSREILVAEGDWDHWIKNEQTVTKDVLKRDLQGVLDSETILIPAIADRMAATKFDILFISGVGEVFPYIRSHNVLNNLQKKAKHQPTLMFFPGEYTHSLESGASLDLFGKLRDDKYYRAFNIYDREV